MYFTRNLFPKTLLARFLLIIILPSIIGQALTVFLFYDRHWYNVSYYNSNIITNEIKLLLDNLKKEPVPSGVMQEYLNFSYEFQAGAQLPKKQPHLKEELVIFKTILNSKIPSKNRVKLSRQRKIEVLLQLEEGVIRIILSPKILLSPTTSIFVLWLIFLTISLLSVSLIFIRNQIKSILELARAADAFGRGVEKAKFYKPSGAQEIRKAGIAFLKMQDRIEKQIAKRTQMLAMISHDLRTPLTRMKLQLELITDLEGKAELKQDIESMQQMITSYLDFARGEGGEDFQIIDLMSWLERLIKDNWSSLDIVLDTLPVRSSEVTLRKKQQAPLDKTKIIVQLKVHSFERAITNLISNAIKYSNKIKIFVYSSDANAIIEIEDNGIGIQEAERHLVFTPFYRSDKSRSLESSGSVGLGLAITKEIITGHYGTILLEDSKNLGGLLVRIVLPIFKEDI